MPAYVYEGKSLRDSRGNWEPISQGKWKIMKTRKPLPRVSKRRSFTLRQYPRVKKVFLETHALCFKCGDYVEPEKRTLHHFYGRVGALLIWVPGFRTACRDCHDWVEKHRNDSVLHGYRAPDNLFNRPSLVIPK